jgi:hypothetical protein
MNREEFDLKQYLELRNKVNKAFRFRKIELVCSVILCFMAMFLSYRLKVVSEERNNAITVTKQYYERYMKAVRACEKETKKVL